VHLLIQEQDESYQSCTHKLQEGVRNAFKTRKTKKTDKTTRKVTAFQKVGGTDTSLPTIPDVERQESTYSGDNLSFTRRCKL
jgi:hypothetical protein